MRIEISVKLFNGKSKYRKGSCETISLKGYKLPETHDIADFLFETLQYQAKQGFIFKRHTERVVEYGTHSGT